MHKIDEESRPPLTVTATGFSTYTTTEIVVKVNDQLHFDITLQVGSVKQEVSVAADTVQVESESTQLGDVIESKKILSLPLNGRSYIDLLGLQAGVIPVTSNSMQQDRPVSGISDDFFKPIVASLWVVFHVAVAVGVIHRSLWSESRRFS